MAAKSSSSAGRRQQGRKTVTKRRSSSSSSKSSRQAARTSRERAKARKAVNRDLERLLNLGLYNPRKRVRKAKGKPQASKAQARYVKRRMKQVVHLISDHLAVRPKGSKATRARTIKAAKKAGYATSSKAVFVSRKGGVRKVRLKAATKGEPAALVETRYNETRDVYLADFDMLMLEKEKLRQKFDRAAKRAKGDRLRFYVEGKYGSNATFAEDEFEELWSALEEYWDKQAHLYTNARTLSIGRVRPGMGRNKVVTKRDREIAKARREATRNRRYR